MLQLRNFSRELVTSFQQIMTSVQVVAFPMERLKCKCIFFGYSWQNTKEFKTQLNNCLDGHSVKCRLFDSLWIYIYIYVFKGICHPVYYGDLVYKLRRVKDTPNFISSGSKIVKRLRRRQYDPLIIETTIGLVLGPCTALCRLFLKHCTLTNKAVGTIWRALSKPPQRRQGPDLRPLWLLVGTPSAIRPELAFSRAEHSLPYSDVTIYIFAILYLSSMPYV